MRRALHDALMAGAGAGVVVAAEVGTVLLVGIVHQLASSRAEVTALQHSPVRVTVTASPKLGPSMSPRPVSPSASPSGGLSASLGVVAAGATTPTGGTGGSSGGVAAPPVSGPSRRPPRAPSSPPPTTTPPRQQDCSTVRVTVDRPPLGVWACASVQATATTRRPANGAR